MGNDNQDRTLDTQINQRLDVLEENMVSSDWLKMTARRLDSLEVDRGHSVKLAQRINSLEDKVRDATSILSDDHEKCVTRARDQNSEIALISRTMDKLLLEHRDQEQRITDLEARWGVPPGTATRREIISAGIERLAEAIESIVDEISRR